MTGLGIGEGYIMYITILQSLGGLFVHPSAMSMKGQLIMREKNNIILYLGPSL